MMDKNNLEYTYDGLSHVRKLAQLGALSTNNMEAQIFRKINDALAGPMDCLSAALEGLESKVQERG